MSGGEMVPPDDDAVGYEQARRLRVTIEAAGIDRRRLWLYYFSIGGDAGDYEVDAYLHHSLMLPRLQRDVLAQAANEILADMVPPRAPFAVDVATALADGEGKPAAGRHDAGTSRPSFTSEADDAKDLDGDLGCED